MSVISTARKSRVIWLVAYGLLCVVLGFWGAYDYWVRIPKHESDYAAFVATKETFDRLEKQSATKSLSASEITEYEAAKTEIAGYKDGVPEPVPAYDRPLQLWVYVISCGVLGTPWCFWGLIKLRRQRFELEGDGTLIANEIRLSPDQIKSIDMSKWMSKSVATVHGTNGEQIKLDDYMMKNAHLIIGRIAHRFDPGAWKEDGTKWKPAEELTGEETGKETGKNSGETADSAPRET
jgi:hypothetical protein